MSQDVEELAKATMAALAAILVSAFNIFHLKFTFLLLAVSSVKFQTRFNGIHIIRAENFHSSTSGLLVPPEFWKKIE